MVSVGPNICEIFNISENDPLSPLLFVIIIDVITEEIEEGTPWAMLFADDLVLCDPDRDDGTKIREMERMYGKEWA